MNDSPTAWSGALSMGNYQACVSESVGSNRVLDCRRRSCETRYGHRDWTYLMSVLQQMRTAIKDGIFGATILPEEFATGIPDPQQEISVMLEGMGAPIDVTFRHSTACSDPFLLAIAFDQGQLPSEQELRRLSLRFYARRGERPLLGDIRLHWRETLTVSGGSVLLFAPRSARNRCLPRLSAMLTTHCIFSVNGSAGQLRE